ncbi:MAG: hypothetical protein HKM95_14670 [Inquilinus sp.]|nr:hypothetical protein [Inquilinus sp.]
MWKWLIVVLATTVLMGCETTPVGPIEAEQSMLRVGLPTDAWPTIARDLIETQEAWEERWDWPSGSLAAVRTRRRQYFPQDFADPEDLLENVGRWPTFVRSDVPVGSIKRGENEIGGFLYAVANKRNRRCFFMLQGIAGFRPPSTEPVGGTESSDGYIRFYQCASSEVATEADLEAQGLVFANSLSLNW